MTATQPTPTAAQVRARWKKASSAARERTPRPLASSLSAATASESRFQVGTLAAALLLPGDLCTCFHAVGVGFEGEGVLWPTRDTML